MPPKSLPVSNAVLDVKMDTITERVVGIEIAMRDVSKTLAALGRLEERFAVSIDAEREKSGRIAANESRIGVLQAQMAPLLAAAGAKSQVGKQLMIAALAFAGLFAAQVLGTWATLHLNDTVATSQRTQNTLLATPAEQRLQALDAIRKQSGDKP